MSELMVNVNFASVLPPKYRGALEDLLYFNPNQGRVRSGIVESVSRYGNPRIVVDGNRLRVEVEGLQDVQVLFAFDGISPMASLIGVVIFSRVEHDTVALLHIAVRAEYTLTGRRADAFLVLRLIATVLDVCRRIKGVQSLVVMYPEGVPRKLPV